MMGQLPAQQNALFYEFCLEKHIPDEHLLRQIDQFLDFDQTRVHLDPFYTRWATMPEPVPVHHLQESPLCRPEK